MRIVGSVHVVVVILLVSVGLGWYADRTSEQLHEQNLKIQLGLERMVRLNRSITDQVAMAVLDKNTLRAASYPSLKTELEATVREVEGLTRDMLLASDMLSLKLEQEALREVEAEVFDLMREDQWQRAYEVLLGGGYVMSLKLYEINSDAAVGALTIELANNFERHDKLRDATLVLRLSAMLLLLWVGWRYSVRLQTEVDEQQRLRQAVTTANRVLEEKVRLRTQELEAANVQLATLSATDGLTGLPNRRRFDAYWAQEWQRALRAATPLAVIMLDVDHFKAYNDHYGHQQGDECLRQVGAALRATIRRAGELVARYGGEEFVVVMPGAGQAHALETAQAIRAAIEAAGMAHEASGVAPVVTVSVGVAWGVPTPTDARELLVQQADTALYAAKAQGRNRVVCAERG
ncbi:MAG: diguanylate cyclase [Burkholderiaceae bacterium]|nr:diguanylate cyclase [Burkholderiaceae bacterium]